VAWPAVLYYAQLPAAAAAHCSCCLRHRVQWGNSLTCSVLQQLLVTHRSGEFEIKQDHELLLRFLQLHSAKQQGRNLSLRWPLSGRRPGFLAPKCNNIFWIYREKSSVSSRNGWYRRSGFWGSRSWSWVGGHGGICSILGSRLDKV